MAARLEDQRLAHFVDIIPYPIAPLNDRRAREARQAAHNNPEGFSPCVDLDSVQHSFDIHRRSQFKPARADGTLDGSSQSFERDVSTTDAIVMNNQFTRITEVGSAVVVAFGKRARSC
jgi:hypothetical protein